MILFRRLSILSRRHLAARAGLVAFGIAMSLGLGLGVALCHAGERTALRDAGLEVNKSLRIGISLDHGLDESRRALRFLSKVPSVLDRHGAETRAFATFLEIYPQFSSASLTAPPARKSTKGVAGPRALRLSHRIGDTEQRVYATLKSGWSTDVLGKNERFGQSDSGTITLLVSSHGLRTRWAASPPNWEELETLKAGETRQMVWGDGETYVTGLWKLKMPGMTNVNYAVVSGAPLSHVAMMAGQAKRVGMGFGIFLGLVAGTVAWVGIARSTKRLRNLNEVLEVRVLERTAELATAERSFRGIFENVPLGLYQCDPNGRFIRVNPMLAVALGYADPDALIAGLGSLQAIGDIEDRSYFLERLRSEGEVRSAMTFAVRGDGRPVWLAESARAVRDADGKILLIEGAMHDVTAQRELEDQLRRIGATDPLTLLLNRRGLEEAIEAAEAPVSFLAFDIDDFKRFNDTYGHPAGDRALQVVADAIRVGVPAGEAAARSGGEEFVVVLSRTDAEAARSIAEGLRESVARCDILETSLTLSGGVATAQTVDSVAEAFAAADRALYLAKEAGRNQIVVNPVQLA